jgi:hypothetical protein
VVHGGRVASYSGGKKLRIVTLVFGTARCSLTDGHIPNPNGVRVSPGTGYRVVSREIGGRRGP